MLNVSSYTTIDTVLCFTVGLPKETTLQDNVLFKISPNPYKGETKISFKLIREAHVTVGVYNVLGEIIVKLVEGMQLAGEHNYSFSAEALGHPAGLYIVLIKVGSEQYSKRIVEVR
ncbi:MAG: T9SS type A sorting domain-containing protein [Flavobacteriales bacterium]|nr:T9SS type A sorting domain-containing protein [Flavobacteriales bacterium]